MRRDFWPRLAVGAIVLKDDKILLVKRKYPPSAGWWSLPGGHVKEGETLVEAVIRELKEETSLTAESAIPFGITEFIRLNNDGSVKYHYVIFDFLVDVIDGKPKPNDESISIGFFDLKEALNMRITITTRKVIHALLAGIPSPYPVHHFRTVVRGDEYEDIISDLIKFEKAVGLR